MTVVFPIVKTLLDDRIGLFSCASLFRTWQTECKRNAHTSYLFGDSHLGIHRFSVASEQYFFRIAHLMDLPDFIHHAIQNMLLLHKYELSTHFVHTVGRSSCIIC